MNKESLKPLKEYCHVEMSNPNTPYSPLNKIGRFQNYYLSKKFSEAILHTRISLEEISRILDLGCGQGNWLNTIASIRGKADGLVGIDLSAPRIGLAKLTNPGICFKKADMRNLPLEDNSCDLVISFASLMFLPEENDLKAVFEEIFRVLSNNGFVFLFEPEFKGSTPGTRGIDLQTILKIGNASNLKIIHTSALFRRIGRFSTASLIRRLPEAICHLIEGMTFLPGSNRLYVLKPIKETF